MFQLLFLSGNPCLLCRGPRGTHCLPQLEPDTIRARSALPHHRARPLGRGQHHQRHWDILLAPGALGRREGAGEQLCRPGPHASSEVRNTSSQVELQISPATLSPGHHPCQQPSVGVPSQAGLHFCARGGGCSGPGALPAAPNPPGALREPVLTLWGCTSPIPFHLLK